MLSYQHQYHAGNHADVLKHWVLLECVRYMQNKDKPFDYIDTHAGAGLYRLDYGENIKPHESREGVLKLAWDRLPGMEDYHRAVGTDLARHRYPGSPLLVKRLLRPGDKAWLFEMHPGTVEQLRRHCAERRVSHVHQEDGFKGVMRLLPNSAGRAVVLIDPSYEVKADYRTVADVMERIYRRMRQAMVLLWYPVVERHRVDGLEKAIRRGSMRNVQQFELGIDEDDAPGMTASGVIALNPPWTLADRFKATMPAVADMLSRDGGQHCRHRVLVDE